MLTFSICFIFPCFSLTPLQRVRCSTVTRSSTANKPLTPQQYESARQQAHLNAGLIYVVRAYIIKRAVNPSDRHVWKYVGRAYNSREEEELTTTWMNANHMDKDWRRATVLKYPCHWFRVPVASKNKQISKTKFTKKRSSYRKIKRTYPSSCTRDCLVKFFGYVGLDTFRDKFNLILHKNPGMSACIKIMRSMGKFCHENKPSFDILQCTIKCNALHLCQIRAVHIDTTDVDNSHAICVFNNLIFDANIDSPLEMSRENLNRCCVGGSSWIYQMVVKCAVFTPNHNVTRFVLKNLRKITPLNISSCS